MVGRKAFRWGIAGFGWVARDYMAPGIEAAGGTIACVCDPSETARAAAARTGAIVYDDLALMVREQAPDAVYVASPNAAHPQAVRELAAAGVPVLCEKPMAADVAGAEAIGQAVNAAGILYGTAFDQRHHPGHAALREAVDGSAVGRVAAVRIVYCCWVDPAWSRGNGSNWRSDPRMAGGGAVLDLAPHGLDLCEFLLGRPVEDLSMVLQRRIHDYAVEDGGIVIGRTDNGILVQLHTAYNTPEALPRRRIEIVGETGALVAEDTMGQDAGGRVTRLCGRGGKAEPVSFDTNLSPFTRQAAAFQDAVRGAPHDYDVMRDLALSRCFFSAYEEARSCL